MNFLVLTLIAIRPTPSVHKINEYLNLTDSSAVSAIDKINRYNIMENFLSLEHQIETKAARRIYLEFHLGGGVNYDRSQDTFGLIGMVSFKLNLTSPKIPNYTKIIADIHRLRYLIKSSGFSPPEGAKDRIDEIERRLIHYHHRFWFKRFSFGVSIPFQNVNYSPSFNYQDTYLCFGCDFGDIITIQLGANMNQKVMVGLSIDLSTPLYSLAEDFKSMIGRLFNLPTRYPEYYY